MAQPQHHEDHGHSVAAWTAVVIALIGFAVMSWAVLDPSVTLFVVGAVIVVIAGVVGKLLGMAGYGAKDVPPASDTEKSSGVR